MSSAWHCSSHFVVLHPTDGRDDPAARDSWCWATHITCRTSCTSGSACLPTGTLVTTADKGKARGGAGRTVSDRTPLLQLRDHASSGELSNSNMGDNNAHPARLRSKSKSAFGALKVLSRRYDVRPPQRQASTELRESLVTQQDVNIGKASGKPGTLQGWEVRGALGRWCVRHWQCTQTARFCVQWPRFVLRATWLRGWRCREVCCVPGGVPCSSDHVGRVLDVAMAAVSGLGRAASCGPG